MHFHVQTVSKRDFLVLDCHFSSIFMHFYVCFMHFCMFNAFFMVKTMFYGHFPWSFGMFMGLIMVHFDH